MDKIVRQKSAAVNVLMAVVALGLAYAAASWAIHTGRLLAYAITIILIGLGVRFLIQSLKGIQK